MRQSGQKAVAKLPVQQLAILAVCRFAEPIASTSVFPYLPEMIESFGIDKVSVARWAGITSAVFSLSQCVTAVAWGRASDRFGRKPVILIGLFVTMCTSLFWGLSRNLPMAITARVLSGGSNGNVGIIRTMVAEMVQNNKELQPRAFSVMPLVWSIGSIFGPAFGGFLAQPAKEFPGLFGNNALFIRFPFLLPNLVASIFFATGILTGLFFLKETLEAKKNQRDYGLILGSKMVECFKSRTDARHRSTLQYDDEYDEAESSLLRPTSSHSRMSSSSSKAAWDEEYPSEPVKIVQPPPSMKEVFTKQSVINLAAYTFLALHSVAFDQTLSVFMHLDPQVPDDSNTKLPFKFNGGFGLESGRIGTLFTMYGVVGGLVQFLVFPPVARRYGVLRCLKVCSITFPIIFLVIPYTALIQNSLLQQATMFAIMIVKSFAVIFAFPCSTILLTNSAVSLRILGTLNGFATSISALGRASGPAIAGACLTWGAAHGYIITPWWVMAVISAIGAVPVFYLVEMDGFNGNDDDEREEDLDETIGMSPNSLAVAAGDEVLPLDVNEEAVDTVDGPPLSPSVTRASARESRETHLSVRPGHLERRLSSPIGIRGVGPGGERRLSTGLGVSNVGSGTGGTTFN